jgi:signal transduction histidine kinase
VAIRESQTIEVTKVIFIARHLDLGAVGRDSASMAINHAPFTSKLLTFAAVLTWAAILLSEYFQRGGGIERKVFYLAAGAFLIAFLLAERNMKPGWSVPLALLTLATGTMVSIGGFGLTPASYVIAGSALYARIPRRDFWIVIFLLNALLLAKLVLASNWLWALSAFSAYAGFQIFGFLMTSSTHALSEANAQLTSINAELISTRALLSESARVQERLRLSRELHDVCGHKLTALKLTLRSNFKDTPLTPAQRNLCETLADELLQDVRSVVAQLREHEGIDLAQALQQLGQQWQQPTVTVEIAADARAANVRQAQVLLRIAQEALTNIARHANASSASISLVRNEQNLLMRITDNGQGVATLKPGNGLRGMRERLSEIGGELAVENRVNSGKLARGFQILASVPLDHVAAEIAVTV